MTTTQRADKRGNEDIRPTKISYDGLARVAGSARFSFGESVTALASLSAPIEVRLSSELPSKATFEVSIRPLSNVPGTESKALAGILRSSLEPSLILTKNPRSLVQLVVQSLSPSDSSRRRCPTDVWNTTLAAAMINASTLAFLNSSSVPMCGIVTAVAIARNREDLLIVDPSDLELEESRRLGCFAFLFADDVGSDCIWASWKSINGGGYDVDEVFEARELARKKAEEIGKSIRATIADKFGLKEEIRREHDEEEMIT